MIDIRRFFLICSVLIVGRQFTIAQTTEDFEAETTGATTFSDNGQNFTITNGPGETTYDIEFYASGGWNGTAVDNKFIDNSSGGPPTGDGSSFTITTTDGTDIYLKSFYLFVSNRSLSNSGQPTTLTFVGKKDGATVFTVTKTTGIVDGSTFSPNNGFTFIDFSVEGGSDNSNTAMDEIVISSTNNADYLALDAFRWANLPLPIQFSDLNFSCTGDVSLASWSTEETGTSDYFELERSLDQVAWAKVEGTRTASRGTGSHAYQIQHSAEPGWYRILHALVDGQKSYSEVHYLDCTEISGIAIWPNPGDGSMYIRPDEHSAIRRLELFDLSGRLYYSDEPQGEISETLGMDLRGLLGPGLYLLRVTDDSGNQVCRKVEIR